jgi:hypothetical protein
LRNLWKFYERDYSMRIMGFSATALSILTVLLCAGTAAAEPLTLGEGLKLVTEKG